MPILTPCNGIEPHTQFWEAKCPICGRGGAFQYKSAYLALKHWNELQTTLYSYEHKNIIFTEEWKDTCDRLGYEYIDWGSVLSDGEEK
jgi:hypothetical protein